MCSTQATNRQATEVTREEKEWSKKIARWINAWSRGILWCVPTTLDLANHEWGHHDTHRCAPFDWFKFTLPDLIPTRSLVMDMELTGLDEDCRLFRVRKSQLLLIVSLSLNSTSGDGRGGQRNRRLAHGRRRICGG